MFSKAKCYVMAWFNGDEKLKQKWAHYQLIHDDEMKRLYRQYPASSIRQILNLNPPIDHEHYYHCRISRYFETNEAMDWLIDYYAFLPPSLQSRTHDAITDMVSVYAAHAMCHAHDRMGQFNWSDVLALLESLNHTKPARLIRVIREVHGDDFVKHMVHYF